VGIDQNPGLFAFRRAFGTIALASIVVFGLGALAATTIDPVYKGVPLSAWLKYAADPNPALNADVGDPSEAVRQIGTNGIPLLLQMLEMPDSEPGRNLSASPQ
jgi:hypothetical protein